MSNAEEYHKVNCPACGAPLVLTGPRMRCQFCGTIVERSETTYLKQAPTSPEAQPPAVARPQVQVLLPTRAARRGACGGVIAAIIVVLAISGVVAGLLVSSKGTPGKPILVSLSRSVASTAIPVPTDRQGPADVLVLTYDNTSEQTFLTYLDGLDHSLRWDSPPLSRNTSDVHVVVGSSLVYVSDAARLLALKQSDGTVAWQSTLADSVTSICQDCLQVVGNTLVALSQDGTLQGFEAATGRPVWSDRLNETPRNLWEVQDRVAVLDLENPDEWDSIALQLRDPETGKVVQRIPGSCVVDEYHTERLSIYDPAIILSPSGDTVYFLYGLMPACAQRWDLQSGRLVWQTAAEDHYFDRFNSLPFLSQGTLYGGYDDQVIALDTASGELRVLVQDADYELTALGEQDGILLVSARRTRGSERYELWGVAAQSGAIRWKYVPQDEKPLDAAGATNAKAWAWHLTAQGLVLVHLYPEPPTMLVETLDLQAGRSLGPTAVSLGENDDYWRGIAWADTTAWLTAWHLYAVDLEAGKVLYTWP